MLKKIFMQLKEIRKELKSIEKRLESMQEVRLFMKPYDTEIHSIIQAA